MSELEFPIGEGYSLSILPLCFVPRLGLMVLYFGRSPTPTPSAAGWDQMGCSWLEPLTHTCPCPQTVPQGYTMYGTQMPLQPSPQLPAGSMVLSPGYNCRSYPATHSSPALLERFRQMRQQPSSYPTQQASPYLQPLPSSQR